MHTGDVNRMSGKLAASTEADDSAARPVADASQPFVGQWNTLVSTTNWEKGRIIYEWRALLIAADSPINECSDDAWTRLVGGVTPQHVGRLRRVFGRFGERRDQFPRLYWSHFHAAIDWDDAEMWLEGAVHSRWSVSQMRRQRWETLGAVESERPRDEEIVTGELDEDVDTTEDGVPASVQERISELPPGPRADGPDFGEEPNDNRGAVADDSAPFEADPVMSSVESVRPFENLPPLPDDLADAFEKLKLAILHHKTDGWRDIACADLCVALEALKALALAP